MKGETELPVEFTAAPDADDVDAVVQGLSAFNEADVGPANKLALAAFVRGADGSVIAGLTGFTAWGWLQIEKVWVSDELRGRGVAAELLRRAEAEAVARGCNGAWLDTLNPAARRLYERAGYEVCGELSDFVHGRSRVFMRKRLTKSAV